MALQEFIANAKLRDFARSSKYLVIVDLPRGPSANQNGGANQIATLLRTFGVSSADSFAQSFNRANGQYLSSLFAEVTALPAQNIDSKLHKVYGPGREMPYGRSYTPVNMTFYLDAGYILKEFYESWQGMIFNDKTSHMTYYNEYTTNVHILALDMREGRFGTRGSFLENVGTLQNSIIQARYQCTLEECYPKTIAEIPLGAATNDVARLNVQFQYRKWTNTSQLFGVGNVSSTTHPDPVNYNPSTGQFGT